MKKILILLALILTNKTIYSQQVEQNGNYTIDQNTNAVRNLDLNIHFEYAGNYDSDLKKQTNLVKCYPIIAIKINENSEGHFSTFVGKEKTIFTVESCVKKNNQFTLTIVRPDGSKSEAAIVLDNRQKVKSFWINNESNKSAIIFY